MVPAEPSVQLPTNVESESVTFLHHEKSVQVYCVEPVCGVQSPALIFKFSFKIRWNIKNDKQNGPVCKDMYKEKKGEEND